jgi:DNA-binding SARP family transcriptional activator
LFATTDPGDDAGDTGDVGADTSAAPVRLRIFGPITVEGVDLRPQQLAVLAYLVLHPDATADALQDAVWAGKAPTRERFLNTMHELRRAVGADILPTSTDGRYRVHGVACDAQDFERLRSAAANDGSRLGAGALRAALEFVAGEPLTYDSRHRRHFSWIDLGNHANRWERIVCDTAHELVTAALEDGDIDLARWAAERGLAASPASELLTRDLVAAHLAAGDRRAAERTADAYARLLEDLGLDEPHTLFSLLDTRQAS